MSHATDPHALYGERIFGWLDQRIWTEKALRRDANQLQITLICAVKSTRSIRHLKVHIGGSGVVRAGVEGHRRWPDQVPIDAGRAGPGLVHQPPHPQPRPAKREQKLGPHTDPKPSPARPYERLPRQDC